MCGARVAVGYGAVGEAHHESHGGSTAHVFHHPRAQQDAGLGGFQERTGSLRGSGLISKGVTSPPWRTNQRDAVEDQSMRGHQLPGGSVTTTWRIS